MRQRKVFFIVICLLLMFVSGFIYYYQNNPQVYNALAEEGIELDILDVLGKWEGELIGEECYRLIDENDKEIDQTGHVIFVGDEVILEDNKHYQVIAVNDQERKATCKLVGQAELPWQKEWDEVPVIDIAADNKRVGIYMTHTDESYVPTDGTESKPGNGGILKVGKTLSERLNTKGLDAKISYDKHDPHDANAYHRSRKTAVKLLKSNPLALIDVHRDGVPDPNFYSTKLQGKAATKIRLVVGRQNPHMSANLEFAKKVKAYFDKKQPGLIKGIFMGKGNYNQDLAPRSLLLEVGTHTNSRKAAENGVAVFADGLTRMLGVVAETGREPATKTPATGKGTNNAILWLLGFLVIGGGAYLFISTGSIKGSVKKLSGMSKEFSNYLGPFKNKNKKEKEDDN